MTPADEMIQRAQELYKLQTEIKALRRDAERYRWLRGTQDDLVVGTGPGTVDFGASAVRGTYELWLWGVELDEFIDAALAREKEPPR